MNVAMGFPEDLAHIASLIDKATLDEKQLKQILSQCQAITKIASRKLVELHEGHKKVDRMNRVLPFTYDRTRLPDLP